MGDVADGVLVGAGLDAVSGSAGDVVAGFGGVLRDAEVEEVIGVAGVAVVELEADQRLYRVAGRGDQAEGSTGIDGLWHVAGKGWHIGIGGECAAGVAGDKTCADEVEVDVREDAVQFGGRCGSLGTGEGRGGDRCGEAYQHNGYRTAYGKLVCGGQTGRNRHLRNNSSYTKNDLFQFTLLRRSAGTNGHLLLILRRILRVAGARRRHGYGR